jgi:hypothetical protein
MRGRQMTLSNALHNAAYLNLLMRHSDKVEIACRSSMANSFCGGVIETSPSGLLKRPGYYALQLYARHAKPIPLRLESPKDGPDFLPAPRGSKRRWSSSPSIPSRNPANTRSDSPGSTDPLQCVESRNPPRYSQRTATRRDESLGNTQSHQDRRTAVGGG